MTQKSRDSVKLAIGELENAALELGLLSKPLTQADKVQLDYRINEMLRDFSKDFTLPFVIMRKPSRKPSVTKKTEPVFYVAWIKIDETLPWIELKGTYRTKAEAKKAVKNVLDRARLRIMRISEEGESQKKIELIKELARTKNFKSDTDKH